jgi:hypothetical protein
MGQGVSASLVLPMASQSRTIKQGENKTIEHKQMTVSQKIRI